MRPLERLVKRVLAKDPDQRFQTARDLKAALSWVLDQPPANAPKPSRRMWIGIAAATLVIGALAGGFTMARLRQPPPDQGVLRLQIDPPEGGQFSFGLAIGGNALSPDGRTAALVATAKGKTGLWLRPLDGTGVRLIPGTEGALTNHGKESQSLAVHLRPRSTRGSTEPHRTDSEPTTIHA